MDITQIGAAYTGVKFIKESLLAILNAKIEAAAREKVNEALEKVGTVQDTLFYLRDELSRIQAENYELKEKLITAEDWKARLAEYELKETHGGAVVYQFKGKPTHYVCPSCINKREIHILQDRRVMSGSFDCPGCGKLFPVKPSNHPG